MSSITHKALLVVTSHDKLGNTGKPTGSWLAEITHPYRALLDAGIQSDIASIGGGRAPIDPASIDEDDTINQHFISHNQHSLENTPALADINPANYQAIVFCGGHGTVWDFPHNAEVQRVAGHIFENGGIVAAVCHGPAALLGLTCSNGELLIENRQLTGFSNSEEAAVGLTDTVPFLLEDTLKSQGAQYYAADDFTTYVIEDGRLITGQNPQSAYALGKAVAEKILTSA